MSLSLVASLLVAWSAVSAGQQTAPIQIGGRLELLVDDFLVEKLSGAARLELHHPVAREIVLTTDAPWEGNACGYPSVFRDGKRYRLYYHGLHYPHGGAAAQVKPSHPEVLCYAESSDGIRWQKPRLGLFEFQGRKDNNIVLAPEAVAAVGGSPAHTAVFLDANPDCPADAKYKIMMLGGKPHGLYLLKSADGIHFTLTSNKPVVTKGAFDSENLMFWDPMRKEYREYHRGFKEGVRDIMTAVSKDVGHFPDPEWLKYPGSPPQHLYTNQIQPYCRAPHIFMGFPMRYTDRGWSEPMMALPGFEDRLARAKAHPRYGTAVTDGLFMTSRDGLTFRRWNEAFLRPGLRQKGSWVYGDNMVSWGMVETASHLGDAPDELSLYAIEHYWQGTSMSVRRLTLRMDGFVSLAAPWSGGEMVTKPLVFEGGNLVLNAATSAAGSIQVELQDAAGRPLEGYALADCPEIFCDDLRFVVRWRRGGDVRPLAGKPVRMRLLLKDADVYSFQFVPYEPDPVRPVPPGAKPAAKKAAAKKAAR